MTPIMNRQKKGISVVLTTLIIVVASVVLGTAVTLFGTSLFQTGAQSQGMAITNTHIWQGTNSTNTFQTAVVAFVARNSGDKIIAVDGIQVRGTGTSYSSWYASLTADTTSTVQTLQFAYPTATAPTGVNIINGLRDLDSNGVNDLTTGLAAQSGPVSLAPGKAVVIYVILPGSNNASVSDDPISSVDIGSAVTVQITAGQITQVVTVNAAKNI